MSSRTAPLLSVIKPLTFSITKNSGETSFTILQYSKYSLFRGSSISLFPTVLNPWQGGPPIMPTTLLNSPTRRFNSSRVKLCTSRQTATFFSLLWLYVFTASAHISTAKTGSNPAISKPRDIPPQPQNRSMIFLFIAPF